MWDAVISMTFRHILLPSKSLIENQSRKWVCTSLFSLPTIRWMGFGYFCLLKPTTQPLDTDSWNFSCWWQVNNAIHDKQLYCGKWNSASICCFTFIVSSYSGKAEAFSSGVSISRCLRHIFSSLCSFILTHWHRHMMCRTSYGNVTAPLVFLCTLRLASCCSVLNGGTMTFNDDVWVLARLCNLSNWGEIW